VTGILDASAALRIALIEPAVKHLAK